MIIFFIKYITLTKEPDLSDASTKEEIVELIDQKNKFEYNRDLLKRISEKKFKDDDFLKIGKEKIETIELNSKRDNKKFEINAVEILYSLPENSFTLINDENGAIYLAKVKKFTNEPIEKNTQLKEYMVKQNSDMKNTMLKSYDIYLNDKYELS